MKKIPGEKISELYDQLSEKQKQAVADFVMRQLQETMPERSVGNKWGKNQTHKATGRLIFEYETVNGEIKPLHHMYVELWDRDTGNPDDFLGYGKTDMDGYFEIWYDPDDAGKLDLPDLDLRIYEKRHTLDSVGNPVFKRKLIYAIRGEDNVTQQHYDFGECRVPYWEYDPGEPIPRLLITDEGNPPQSYGPGRSLVMVKALANIELKKRKHILLGKVKNSTLTIRQVENDYPENMTRKLEQEKPGFTRSDEFFGDCFLNGMAASIMDKDPRDPTLYWIHYHWNSYEQDGEFAMPNIDIRFRLEGEKIIPVEITIATRKPGIKEPNSTTEKIIVKPGEERWMAAKRIARVSSALSSELDAHLCQTHLNVEQYAIAAYRNIRDNPIRFVLFPHIKEVALINNSANKLLIGETGYITKTTGFTPESLNQRLIQVQGTLDWKNWKPRKQISSEHRFARASNLFWEFLNKYVDWFFETNEEKIIELWPEIRLFSEELVERSVPAFLCQYLRQNLPPVNDPDSWFDWNERMDIEQPRSVVQGFKKAVSPITTTDRPADADLENLKQVCCYVIHHATFMHWWSNSKQYDEGGELRYNSLGLRYGDHGLFSGEDDDSLLPPPADATLQLWISYMLSNTNFGFILKNEEKDIHPRMISMLRELADDFMEMGVDVSKIPSRTNI